MKAQKKIYIVGICVVLTGFGMLNSAQQENFSPYYVQKKTLFDILPDEPGEIVFLGDSITDGGEWAEMFHDLRIKNRGISGDTTEGVLSRIEEVSAAQPARVFLMIGINDLADGVTVENVLSNIKRITRHFFRKSPDTQLFIQSILPVNDRFSPFPNYTNKGKEIEAVNIGLRAFCRNRGLVYVDLHSRFKAKDEHLDPRYTNDGLHLTGAGYALWKDILSEYIR